MATMTMTTTDGHGNIISTESVTVSDDNMNADILHQQALAALATNRTAIAASNPTNAQVIQQVKNLSAQNNALIRIVLGLLEGTN